MAIAKIEVETPQVPNFLRFKGSHQDSISIAYVPEDQLREIGQAWTEKLVQHAAKLRANVR